MEELASAYDPKLVEEKWLAIWKKKNAFVANAHSSKPPFSVAIPPPNITGRLHVGHALGDTIQDVLARWKRMNGYEVLWVPGTDHAGISTQKIVKDDLAKKGMTSPSKEEFLDAAWAWKETYGGVILSQVEKLGCSCDFSRLAFTMDETRSKAVKTAFKKMYDAGLIYQGDYLVNWDPAFQTAISDEEMEYEEREGHLWHFTYPVKGSNEMITVATSRPETLLGDVAVAVHPEDGRYLHLIGKMLILPLVDREIPVIADKRVDPTFGTGAVKVTPAHDRADYAMAVDHNLPMITVIDMKCIMTKAAGKYAGLPMDKAREAVVAAMDSKGLLVKKEKYKSRVALSDRSKAVVEPMLSKQWYVNLSKFGPLLRSSVEDSRVNIVPKNWESTYFHWVDNLRDWCISRQLWWGHPIPIWYNKADRSQMICYDGEGLPPEVVKNPELWEQDPDVLDTWFSSALWPMTIFGWPEVTPDWKKFYPTSVLVTGYDILFFWVTKMVLMGEHFTGESPFADVFLHGLIFGKSYSRKNADGTSSYIFGEEKEKYDLGGKLPTNVDFKWEKMSKTKGNILDPIKLMETYGTDALRLSLGASASQSSQIDLDLRKFEDFKNFTNKFWNGSRFVLMNLSTLSSDELEAGLDQNHLTLDDRWILSLLNSAVVAVDRHLCNYAFDHAVSTVYNFFWNEFCAYYLELAKPVLFDKTGTLEKQQKNKQKILLIALTACIRLLHPFAPFITEELFEKIKSLFPSLKISVAGDPYTEETIQALQSDLCALSPFPTCFKPDDIDPKIEKDFAFMGEIVHAVRNMRAEMQIKPKDGAILHIYSSTGSQDRKSVDENIHILKSLVKIESVTFHTSQASLPIGTHSSVGDLTLVIPMSEEYKEKEKIRLHKEKERLIARENSTLAKLADETFLAKAPAHLISDLRATLEQAKRDLETVLTKLATL